MSIMPSFQKSLIVEQFEENYLNTFLAIRRNVDEQLARALAQGKEYNAKAKKLKCLETKVRVQ